MKIKNLVLCIIFLSALIILRSVTAHAQAVFVEGEKFEYKISWLKIKAGNGSLELSEILDIEDREVLHIKARGDSIGLVSIICKIRDRMESYIDKEKQYSLKCIKDFREGFYKKKETTRFDQEKHVAYVNGKTIEILPEAKDPFACLYYIRAQKLVVGETVSLNAYDNRKNHRLRVNVLKKETIEVGKNTYETILISPVLEGLNLEGVLEVEGSKIKVWLTDDERRIPVRVQMKITFGSIVVELVNSELP
ncbi:MAG: DUF3108 domain-containing protein [bacterium]